MILLEADHPTSEVWLAMTSFRMLTLTIHMDWQGCPQLLPLISWFCFPSPSLWKSLPALGCEDGLTGRSLQAPEWITFLLTSTCLRGLAFVTADSQLLVSVTIIFSETLYFTPNFFYLCFLLLLETAFAACSVLLECECILSGALFNSNSTDPRQFCLFFRQMSISISVGLGTLFI